MVAVAAQAPALAASTDAPTVGRNAVVACKDPGLGSNCQGYRLSLNLTVQPSDPWTIDLTQVTLTFPSGRSTGLAPAPMTFTDVTMTSNVLNFVVCTKDNSGDKFDLTVTYTATNQRTGVSTKGITSTTAVNVAAVC